MRLAALFIGSLLILPVALPAAAQTTNDDTAAGENWWDKVGAGFFSDATMKTPRPETEIRAHWTGLSADDQAAVRARCATADGTASSLQEGDEDESPQNQTTTDLADRTANEPQGNGKTAVPPKAEGTTTTGSVNGTEVQKASPAETPAPDTGLAGGEGDGSMVTVCQLIAKL
jgi:hypothetical protein